jgi:hypothetical protein
MEFLRLDSSQIAGVNANQAVALIVALAAGFFLYWRHRPAGNEGQESADLAETESDASE